MLVDLLSTQGTFVNKQRIKSNEPYKLCSGDIIQVGLSKRFYIYSELQESSTDEISEDEEFLHYQHQKEETDDEAEYDKTTQIHNVQKREVHNRESLLHKISGLEHSIKQNKTLLESLVQEADMDSIDDDPLER